MKNSRFTDTNSRLLAGFILFVCQIHFVQGEIRIVSSQGEIDHAIAVAVPGDTISLADGTYDALKIEFKGNGTEAQPITLKAANPGQCVLTGDSQIIITGSHLVVEGFKFDGDVATGTNVVLFKEASHCRLRDCVFIRCGNNKWRHIVKIDLGSCSNRVDHNYFERLRGQGVGIGNNAGCADNWIDHNHFNRTEGDGGANNGFEPIQLGQGKFGHESMRTIVEYNLIENMREEDDADPELISVKSGGNIIRYNTFRNNSSSRNLTLRYASDCIVEDNFLLGSGIRAYGSGHRIFHNYIVGADNGVSLPGGNGTSYPDTTDVLIADNLILDTQDCGIKLGGQGPLISEITVQNNVVESSRGMLYEQEPGLVNIHYRANTGFAKGSARVSSSVDMASVADPGLIFDGKIYRLPSQADPGTNPVSRQPLESSEVGPRWLRAR